MALSRAEMCMRCNTGLGNFSDNCEVMNRAIIYLQECGLGTAI